MKQLNNFILEKLKISSKSKISKITCNIKDFESFVDNNKTFGKPLPNNIQNGIEIGKCYKLSEYEHHLIYLFPFYIYNSNNNEWAGISLTFTEASPMYNEKDYCALNYVRGKIDNITYKLKLSNTLSNKFIKDYDINIDAEKYMNIIEDLYNISKRETINTLRDKYDELIDENNQ